MATAIYREAVLFRLDEVARSKTRLDEASPPKTRLDEVAGAKQRETPRREGREGSRAEGHLTAGALPGVPSLTKLTRCAMSSIEMVFSSSVGMREPEAVATSATSALRTVSLTPPARVKVMLDGVSFVIRPVTTRPDASVIRYWL